MKNKEQPCIVEVSVKLAKHLADNRHGTNSAFGFSRHSKLGGYLVIVHSDIHIIFHGSSNEMG